MRRRALLDRPVLRRALAAIALALWTGFVLYPDPRPLAISVHRLFNPPVEPAAVNELAAILPAEYAAVETFSQNHVPYCTAWDLYGLFWYFPTVSEILSAGAGDCQAEALLTASILEAKGLPYTLHYSFDHVWVDYPNRAAVAMEDPATAIASISEGGWMRGLPDRLPIGEIVRTRLQYHWSPMPATRKGLLLLGLLGAFVLGEWPSTRRLVRRAAPPSSPTGVGGC